MEFFLATFGHLGRVRFIVQNYCGQKKCKHRHGLSAGGLDGSLPQIFSFFQNWGIPSALSGLILALFSLVSAVAVCT